MKSIFFSIALVTFCASCATCRVSKSLQENERIGTVHLGTKDCPVVISTKEDGKMKGFYPINIDDSLKVDGKQFIFTYVPSRAPQPEGCDVDMTISLQTTRWLK
jgi:hypothetical protein